MNSELFPYVAAVLGVATILYTLWSRRLLRKRAKAVEEALRAVERTAPGPSAKDKKAMKGMIADANDMQAAGLIYNRAVVSYNRLLSTYPTAFFAFMFGFEKAELYDIATAPAIKESKS